jgi:hypothetical protein
MLCQIRASAKQRVVTPDMKEAIEIALFDLLLECSEAPIISASRWQVLRVQGQTIPTKPALQGFGGIKRI